MSDNNNNNSNSPDNDESDTSKKDDDVTLRWQAREREGMERKMVKADFDMTPSLAPQIATAMETAMENSNVDLNPDQVGQSAMQKIINDAEQVQFHAALKSWARWTVAGTVAFRFGITPFIWRLFSMQKPTPGTLAAKIDFGTDLLVPSGWAYFDRYRPMMQENAEMNDYVWRHSFTAPGYVPHISNIQCPILLQHGKKIALDNSKLTVKSKGLDPPREVSWSKAELWKEPQTTQLKSYKKVIQDCLRRRICEDQLRVENGLGSTDPVSIPEPGVPNDIAVPDLADLVLDQEEDGSVEKQSNNSEGGAKSKRSWW